jgi:hypothetical protein
VPAEFERGFIPQRHPVLSVIKGLELNDAVGVPHDPHLEPHAQFSVVARGPIQTALNNYGATLFKDGVGFDPLKLAQSVQGLVGLR